MAFHSTGQMDRRSPRAAMPACATLQAGAGWCRVPRTVEVGERDTRGVSYWRSCQQDGQLDGSSKPHNCGDRDVAHRPLARPARVPRKLTKHEPRWTRPSTAPVAQGRSAAHPAGSGTADGSTSGIRRRCAGTSQRAGAAGLQASQSLAAAETRLRAHQRRRRARDAAGRHRRRHAASPSAAAGIRAGRRRNRLSLRRWPATTDGNWDAPWPRPQFSSGFLLRISHPHRRETASLACGLTSLASEQRRAPIPRRGRRARSDAVRPCRWVRTGETCIPGRVARTRVQTAVRAAVASPAASSRAVKH